MVQALASSGYIKSPNIAAAMEKVPRESFVLKEFRRRAYHDEALMIPGDQTISAPHIHAVILSLLDLKPGDKFLEVGSGSGILLAYARELIGRRGKVVGIELNEDAYNFSKNNLKTAKYSVTVVHGDGSLGYAKHAPYDKIVVSAAAPDVPKPLLEQLKPNGTLVIVIGAPNSDQSLIKIHKTKSGKLTTKEILPVIFVPLRGAHGWK